MRKTVLRITLLLLVIGVNGSALHLQPTKADPQAQLLLETDEYGYIWLWENVTITLTNISNETVEIEGYPAWGIFTYPEEEPVYPGNFSTSLWWLDLGEKDTLAWNQYNEVNKTLVLPGMYVVRDTQGRGLSAYFEIVWYVRYTPDPQEVGLAFLMVNETAYVEATITHAVFALKVVDWGIVVGNNSHFGADSEVWFLISDFYLQMVQVLSYTYELGYLESGCYNFTFTAWGIPVKSICFIVGLLGDVNYDGKVDIRDIYITAKAFGSYPCHPRWNPPADLDDNSLVDMRDIFLVIVNFGKTYL